MHCPYQASKRVPTKQAISGFANNIFNRVIPVA